MTYLLIVLLWIAPATSAEQKPDTSTKQGGIQERAGQQPQGNAQKQPRAEVRQIKPSEAAQTETYDLRKDTLYRAYLWFTIFGVPIALGKLHISKNKSTFSKEARGNG